MHKITKIYSNELHYANEDMIPEFCETVKIDNLDDLNELFEDFGIPYKGKWKPGIWHLVYNIYPKNKEVKFYFIADGIRSKMWYSGYICAIHITRLIRND